jgi:hypothetical protein
VYYVKSGLAVSTDVGPEGRMETFIGGLTPVATVRQEELRERFDNYGSLLQSRPSLNRSNQPGRIIR